MRHIQGFMATNELGSMKKEYAKNFEELSNWIRVSEEKLSTQQILTGKASYSHLREKFVILRWYIVSSFLDLYYHINKLISSSRVYRGHC